VAAGLVLRMYAGCDLFLHTWDERYHALVAKHLMQHPLVPTLYDQPVLPYDYRDWRANHVWLHKPPLALWMMAASMRLLGADEIAMRLPSLALSALAVLLTWVIGTHFGGRRVGLLAAGFQAVNGYLLQLPGGRVAVDHVDNAVIFFVELAILLAVLDARLQDAPRRTPGRTAAAAAAGAMTAEAPPPAQSHGPARSQEPAVPAPANAGALPAGAMRAITVLAPLAIGATTGLAVLSKSLPGLLPVPVWLAMQWGRRRSAGRIAAGLLGIAAGCAAVALPWQLYVWRQFPREARWESAYSLYHLRVPIEGLGGSPLYHLLKMPRFFGELIWLALGWFLAGLAMATWRLARARHRPAQRDLIEEAAARESLAVGDGTTRPRAAGSGPDDLPAARDSPHAQADRSESQAPRAAVVAGREWHDLPALAAWLLLPYLAFSFAATKLGGYVMVAAPALFIVEAGFWLWLWDRRPQRPGHLPHPAPAGTSGAGAPSADGQTPEPRRRFAAAARRALHWAVLVLLPLLPLRYTIERMKIRPGYDRNPAWARALRELPARLGPGPPVVLFHLDRPLEAMFYTPYVAYEGLPTPDQARRLAAAGYRVVVLDAASLPPEARRLPEVELRREAVPLSALDDGTGFRLLRVDGSDSPLTGTTTPPR
jgi:4-amino-4-deoxy-L-arabinose transferase-like glycosyltransferase